MKKNKFISFIFLVFASISFVACDNEPIDSLINPGDFGGENPGGSSDAVFKADFSGNTWVATATQAMISGNLIEIAGVKANGEGFGFLIDGSSVGTYPANDNLLAFTPANSEFGYWSFNTDNPSENTGSITISEIDTVNKTISGTFNFKGYWSDDDAPSILPILFTNGVFTDIPYITQPETNDTFYAKVNGTEFVDVDLLALELGINGQNYISIGAQNAALNSMTVSVRDNLGPGTYPITGNIATDVVQANYEFDDDQFNAVTGSVTIQSKTATRIKGTFSFVTNGATPFTITEGAFDVEY